MIRTLFGIDLANISRLQLIRTELRLLLDALLVSLGQADELFHLIHIVPSLTVEIVHLQCLGPYLLVQVHQHVLLQPRLTVVDRHAVVVTV